MRKAVFVGRRAFFILCGLPLLSLTMVRSVAAQTGEAPGGATISVDVNLVMLPATVTDRKGNFVSGLQASNFHVFEDGVPQTIRVFQHEDVPVAVGLVIDNSGSMRTKRPDVIAAALAFIDTSNSSDRMFVVNFNEHVTFGLPPDEPFAATRADLDGALHGVQANGMTALYDAIETGLDRVQQSPLDRKVLIVISDGGDNASHHTLKQVLDAAGRSNVLIYTIGLFDEYDNDSNPGVLKKIARETGGEAYLPDQISQLIHICKRIAEDIRNQYSIGYVPTNRNYSGGYRNIRVTATGPHGEHLSVRTRSGYLASPQGEEVTTAHGKLP